MLLYGSPMDFVLDFADTVVLDAFYDKLGPLMALNTSSLNDSSFITELSAWPRSYIPRQLLSLFVLLLLGVHVMYFLIASLSYYFLFNHQMMLHPRFLPNQISLEIKTCMRGFPVMIILMLPFFLGEIRGWSKLYMNVDDQWGGWWYLVFSLISFLLFTDFSIYWIHRCLHHPLLYKHLHKLHHKWISELNQCTICVIID